MRGQVNTLPALTNHVPISIAIPSHVPKDAIFRFEGGWEWQLKTTADSLTVTPRYVGVQKLFAYHKGQIVWEKYYQVKGLTEKQVFFVNYPNYVRIPIKFAKYDTLIFETDNGRVIAATQIDAFAAVPTKAGKCKIIAKLQGQKIWEDEFEVRKETTPVSFLANMAGKPLDLQKPLPAQHAYRVMIKADSVFCENVKDYGHRAMDIDYVLYRQNKPIKQFYSVDSTIQSPQSIGAKSGDKIQVVVRGIQLTCSLCCHSYYPKSYSEFIFTVK